MEITSCMEDYLEAVLILKERNKVARVKDLSALLQVKTPTVNSALKCLTDKGLIEHEHYGYIDLTVLGEKIAKDIFCKHQALTHFLEKILGVDKKEAAKDACRMEHTIGVQTFTKLRKFVKFIEDKPNIIKGFNHGYIKRGTH
ncbi:MAG: metal-dependent transcriptional regulator [Candidatus Omnitrophica bacterium]|nr:metal-dependent transcriptional regulator [Candidatus Omnitrophota bacterium]